MPPTNTHIISATPVFHALAKQYPELVMPLVFFDPTVAADKVRINPLAAKFSLVSLCRLAHQHCDTAPTNLLDVAQKLAATPTLKLAPSDDIEAKIVIAMLEIVAFMNPALSREAINNIFAQAKTNFTQTEGEHEQHRTA